MNNKNTEKLQTIDSLTIHQTSLGIGKPSGQALHVYYSAGFPLLKASEDKFFYSLENKYFLKNSDLGGFRECFNQKKILDLNEASFIDESSAVFQLKIQSNLGDFKLSFSKNLNLENLDAKNQRRFEDFKICLGILEDQQESVENFRYYSPRIKLVVAEDMNWVENKDSFNVLDSDLSSQPEIVEDSDYKIQRILAQNNLVVDVTGNAYVVYYYPVLDF